MLYKLFNMDTVEKMKSMEANSVDLIIADPPYFQIKGDFDFIWKNKEDYLNWCREWLLEAKRILKDTGTLILWGGVGKKPLTFARLAILIEDEEIFERQNWVTQRNTRGIGSKKNYMSAREDFLFLTKTDKYTFNIPYSIDKSNRTDLGSNGKPRKNEFKRISNVWYDLTEASQSSIERCFHPTVKSLKICERLILTHSNPKDFIFIPFSGSGSEIISSILNDRYVEGTELDKEYFDESIIRIKKLVNLLLNKELIS